MRQAVKAAGQKQLRSLDQARVASEQPTVPCSDCPFRRESLRGWLGGAGPVEYLKMAHGDCLIECHTRLVRAGVRWQCAGAAIFRANIAKRPRDRAALVLPVDRIAVFATGAEFTTHHSLAIDGEE